MAGAAEDMARTLETLIKLGVPHDEPESPGIGGSLPRLYPEISSRSP
ncbi:hypothetical protein DB31_6848 [Hyalangium minutum]|uniref:Uncharacterized protein n=1 Tax=Hyalangium minutum TaxID=394096 RepID=A0A085WMN3_9BACT|nr:hypothetical protein DB31_6848 [Hyalangium minutum]